jgi:CMP/dCMP kinase
MIVTLDGPAASGKGTLAKGLANRLGFAYLDTGAMYRAVAHAALAQRVALDDAAAITSLLPTIHIEMPPDRVLLNGEDVTQQIRVPAASQGASKVAAIPDVRSFLIPQQRRIAAGRNIICEGRDQGTVVFPNAPAKFFITAEVRVRAERRCQELRMKGVDTTLEREIAEIVERDKRDSERADGPLRKPEGAIEIDTSDRTVGEVLDLMEEVIRRCAIART